MFIDLQSINVSLSLPTYLSIYFYVSTSIFTSLVCIHSSSVILKYLSKIDIFENTQHPSLVFTLVEIKTV